MQGLWRTLAYIAEDKDSFSSQLAAIAAFTLNSNLKNSIEISNDGSSGRLNLEKQPTQQTLRAIDAFLRRVDPTLKLTAYELAEVNRIAYETRDEVPPHKNLKDYWAGLGSVGPANRASPGFMEAVGALAVDNWSRSNFAAGNIGLSQWFDVTPAQETALRSKVTASSPSDLAATAYVAKSWPSSCGSLIAMAPNWVHMNL